MKYFYLSLVILTFIGCIFKNENKSNTKPEINPLNIVEDDRIKSNNTCFDTLKIELPKMYPIEWSSIEPGLQYWPYTVDGSSFFVINELYGPIGATTSNFPPGIYSMKGTYDLSEDSLTGELEMVLSRSVHRSFYSMSKVHLITENNLTGCFHIQMNIGNIEASYDPDNHSRIGINLVRPNTDPESYDLQIISSTEIQ